MTTNAPTDPRSRILQAAERLLRSSPDGQVSTREVCQEARVTPPTLYHHFGDKDALLDEAVADGFDRYLQSKRAVARSDDPARGLRLGWDMHVTFGVTHPSHYRLMFGNPRAHRTPPAAFAAERELREIVTGWERSGRLAVPIETATAVLQATAVGTTLQLIGMAADADHPLSRQVRDLVAAALLRPASASHSPVPPETAGLADRLRHALPSGPIGPLRAAETALLHEWLTDLGSTAEPAKD